MFTSRNYCFKLLCSFAISCMSKVQITSSLEYNITFLAAKVAKQLLADEIVMLFQCYFTLSELKRRTNKHLHTAKRVLVF